jgi:hypothetical protein
MSIEKIEQAWAWKDTPFHVDTSTVSKTGGVYHNDAKKTVVVRFSGTNDIAGMLELADTALTDAYALRAKLMVCDLRPLGGVAQHEACAGVLLHLAYAGVVSSLALLTRDPAVHPVTPEVQAALVDSQVDWKVQSSFEAVAQWASGKSEAMSAWLASRPKDFRASYCGSTFSIPDLGCTVLRSSGDSSDPDLSAALLAQTLQSHKEINADAFIFDTSSSPPITEPQRYRDTYKNAIFPFLSSGNDRFWIHVRSGDALLGKDAPPVASLLKSFNIELYEVETMSEALRLLRSIRGVH